MTVGDAMDRLAVVTAAIEAEGGSVTSAAPLAHPDAPEVVAAHWVSAAADSREAWEQVELVLEAHRVDVSGMVPWQPPEEEVADESGGM